VLAAAIALPGLATAELLELDLMTYNIYWGGQDHDPAHLREDEWLDLIIREAPDVLLLQECNGWLPSDDDLLTHYLTLINDALPGVPPYHGLIADTQSAFDMVLITRFPVLDWEAVLSVWVDGEEIFFRHACLQAALDLDGERHHFLNCHFASGWENREEREGEARALMHLIAELPAGEMVWVGGDFNSYSPVDCHPDSPTQPDYAGGAGPADLVGWEPVQYLLDAGFVDGFRTLHPLALGYTKETYDFFVYPSLPTSRVDFLLHAPWTWWDVQESEVLDDDLGDLGSDHYPVWARYTRPSAADVPAPSLAGTRPILVHPNPTRGGVNLRLDAPGRRQVVFEILTADGRRIASLPGRPENEGTFWSLWDGTDARGRRLPAGTYYVRQPCHPASAASAILLLPR
jgi:endonuclease/exonuclease/phosphatase family metal-dependent hydrolase